MEQQGASALLSDHQDDNQRKARTTSIDVNRSVNLVYQIYECEWAFMCEQERASANELESTQAFAVVE